MNTQTGQSPALQSSIRRYAGLATLFEPDNLAIIHAINQYQHAFSDNAHPSDYGLNDGNCGFILSAIDCAINDFSILLESIGRTANHYPVEDFVASEDLPILLDCFATLSTLAGCILPELMELQGRIEWVRMNLGK